MTIDTHICEINYAAIDIGSNAVRLLIKKVEEGGDKASFSKVLMLRVPLRLGFDVFAMGKISEQREKNMIRLMKAFNHLMKIYDVEDYRACATSAMRDAKNGPEIIKNIEKKTGIHIEIIDGQEEAKIVYNNHIEYMKDRTGNYMYVDVGGGSTEINLLSQGELVCSRSYNIGTVRILNNAVKESEWERMKNDLTELAQSYPKANIIGSGGNINKLYRLVEKKDKKQLRITVNSLNEIHQKLKALTVEERIKQYDLKSDRADVIVPAGDIFLTIAGILGSEYIYVPVIGLSDGIIDDLYLRNQEKLKVSYEQEETPGSKTNKKDKKKSEKDKGKKAKPIDTTTEKQ
ncbi:Ppx/GppA phosphatase family protein [Bacteroides ilei]|uniref:Ppx/GppA phosphatase family protein n=1 Tax=Bacteroides ilei TaxID=1907658 RepID=UPI0009308747|nr:exopolyphosphatase [Bacteroides ilei]